MKAKSIIFLIFVICLFAAKAQKETTLNLPKFDQRRTHFGFIIGINAADFVLHRKSPLDTKVDSLIDMYPKKTTGFNLGIVSALHFNRYLSLRFTPNLAFSQRDIYYEFRTLEGNLKYKKQIESTLINFPLTIKFKSVRLNNFSAYLIGGGAYSLDLASNEGTDNFATLPKDIIVKIAKNDYMAEVGFGTDFYLEYFKFGIEIKMSYGLKDILIRENNQFSNPIEELKSKMFLLSFTFEG
ncbi:MAG: porin family protein [Vicingaceae bacterium]